MKAKLLAGLISALCISGAVQAQNNDWPTQKVIKLIAVFPPGGSVDQVARILAPTLQTQLKQNVIVENIGGAFTRFEKTFEKHMDEEQVQSKAMWTKLDSHGEKLVEHNVRIKGIESKIQ